ncbi:FAD:protein FMN transferase [Ampullimonas aquatilis]|uniref:FAD:protein FMN transferase n=1 Tax=Ampullimonas aquatilis TaxID=1341549 RepID=UPI003C73EEEC
MKKRQFLFAGLGAFVATSGLLLGARYTIQQTETSHSNEDALIEQQKSTLAFGTVVTVQARHENSTVLVAAIDAALQAIKQVNDLMSIYEKNSQLSQLNKNGFLNNAHPWLLEILKQSQAMAEISNGLFDITVQRLWETYAQASIENRTPSPLEIQTAKKLIDWRSISINNDQILLNHKDIQLTLNGIAQGYASQKATEVLKQFGIKHALINAGEFASLGKASSDRNWNLGLENPEIFSKDKSNKDILGRLQLDGRYIATSSAAYTTFTQDRKNHHIFDPRTGHSPTEILSVTVLAETGAVADALTKPLFMMSPQASLDFLKKIPGTDAVILTRERNWIVTEGAKFDLV